MALSARKTFNLLFPVACFLVFVYPLGRLSNWVLHGHGLSYLAGFVLWLLTSALMWYSFSGPKMIVRYVMVHWMGASFVLMSLTLLAEVLIGVLPVDASVIAWWALVLGVLLVLLAVLLSHRLVIKNVQLANSKLTQSHRMVQISDVHIGSRQGGFMRRIVSKINAQKPDSVVVTGDLIDSSAVGFDELAPLQDLNAPTYFVIGNHERYADLTKMLGIAKQLGMITLRQAAATQGELQIIGIDDADRRDQVGQMLPSIAVDATKFVVLLYHRPVGWTAARAQGVDLMLSGHTHNGQIFPFNYLVKQQFARIKGLYQAGEASLYVSSGTGTWGPLMRLGSANEITIIDMSPTQTEQ